MANRVHHHPPPDPALPSIEKIDGAAVRRRTPASFATSVATIARAREELQGLTGHKIDSVSGFERTEGGWKLVITVVELQRIPAGTDVLASYEVMLNELGDIKNYHRGKRYFRDQVGDE